VAPDAAVNKGNEPDLMRTIAAALATLALVACTGTESVDAGKALRDGGAAMGKLQTVSANLKFNKGTISFQGFALVSAKALIKLPSDSDTFYTVKQQDLSISLEVIISGSHVFLKVPFSAFRELAGPELADIPDLAKLFDPSSGLPAVVPAGTNAKFVSTDTLAGAVTQQLTADYSADKIRGMLPQLNSSVAVHAHLWVDTTDHWIRKAVLDGAFGDGGKDASVQVDMSGFNSPVVIPSPIP
jgi:hypothetical protein